MTSDSLYTLNHIEQAYDGRTVLRVPSFTVQRGEILAIVGPSGAGKSTLLRLLALLEAPTQGEVDFHRDGQPVNFGTASTEDRRQITMLFQRPLLLSRSVYANVAYGLKLRGQRNGKNRIDTALERVSMLPLAGSHPRKLSGGEAQRVAIARALVIEPRVLLFDEPTANLDPYNVRLIETLVKEQNRDYGTTIVLVTHDIFQAKRLATRVGLMVNGELIEVAAAGHFFTAPKDPRTAAFLKGDLIG